MDAFENKGIEILGQSTAELDQTQFEQILTILREQETNLLPHPPDIEENQEDTEKGEEMELPVDQEQDPKEVGEEEEKGEPRKEDMVKTVDQDSEKTLQLDEVVAKLQGKH